MDHHTSADTEAAEAGARLLGPLADVEPTGPPRTTVAALVAGGRRRRRIRRTVAAGAVAGVTALALLGGGLATEAWPRPWSRSGPVVPAASATSGTVTVTGPTVRLGAAPATFDPATLLVGVGQPASDDRAVWSDEHRERIEYDGIGRDQGSLIVELFPADGHWELPGLSDDTSAPPASKGVPEEGRPGPTIQGRPSRVLSDDVEATVVWQWAPHAWAAIRAMQTGDPLNDVLRTINALTIGPAIPLPLPFTAARPPATYPLRSVSTWTRPSGYSALLTFSDRASMLNDDRSARMIQYDVTSNPTRTGDGKKIENPNTTLDGHPAWVHGDALSGNTWLFDVAGSLIKVNSWYAQGTIDTTALARTITPVPQPTNPAGWSTHPWR